VLEPLLGVAMASQGPALPLALAHNLVAALLLATAYELTRGGNGALASPGATEATMGAAWRPI